MSGGIGTIEIIVRLAYQFGPFLFAILFMLIITRHAHGSYQKVNSRKEPKPSRRECNAYRAYFLSSFIFGVILVAISIFWWVHSHFQPNVYHFVVMDVKRHYWLEVHDAFRRDEWRESIPGVVDKRDVHFVLVRDTPFVPGDVITVKLIPISDPQGPLLSPGGVGVPEIIPLQVRYQGNPIDYFSYEADSRKLVETTVKAQPDTTSFAKEFGMEVEIENFQPGWFLTHLQRTFPVRFELQYSQAMSNRCVTPSGTCYVQQSGPIGSPCWCNTPWGPVTGVLQ